MNNIVHNIDNKKKIKHKTISMNGKQIMLHRYVMECYLGRKLKHHEIIHHKDGDKLNNNISNLEILTRKEHLKKHPETSKRAMDVRTKYNIDYELFNKLYFEELLTIRRISIILDVYEMKIHKYIKDNNLKREIKCPDCGKKMHFKIKYGYCVKCYQKRYKENTLWQIKFF